jgi:glutathione synthase
MRFGFLIDPPGTLHIKKDTSFALMLEAQAQGHEIWLLERGDLSLQAGKLYANVRNARVADDADQPFALGMRKRLPADELDVLFVRTDPPFDKDYLTDTWLLSHAGKRPVVLNSPEGLRNINEKLWAARFADLTPTTLVTSDKAEFLAFLEQYQRVIIKPTDGFGGSAVFFLQAGDKNAAVTFETLSRMNRYVIVQEYLPEATEGDKRILLLQGEILGAVLRLHSDSDHRNNFAAGGRPAKAQISAAEQKICERLKPFLLDNGIFLAGIDVIGERLIEVNVTSPTCLREMQNYYSENLAAKVIQAAASLAEKRHARD